MDIIILVAIFIIAIGAIIFIPRLMINRAVHSVIHIFRQHNAISIREAKTIGELGLNPKPLRERSFKLRDYKPWALQIIRNANVIYA